MLKKQPEAIEFLMKLKIEDCRNLQEIVGENDNEFLNANDILDFEKCIEFMNILGKNNMVSFRKKKDIEIFNLFREKVKINNDIELYFTRYVNNYAEIKNAFDTGLDKSEATKEKIKLLCKESSFTLINQKNKIFKGIYYEIVKDKKKK